jgi:hypothetical protein
MRFGAYEEKKELVPKKARESVTMFSNDPDKQNKQLLIKYVSGSRGQMSTILFITYVGNELYRVQEYVIETKNLNLEQLQIKLKKNPKKYEIIDKNTNLEGAIQNVIDSMIANIIILSFNNLIVKIQPLNTQDPEPKPKPRFWQFGRKRKPVRSTDKALRTVSTEIKFLSK